MGNCLSLLPIEGADNVVLVDDQSYPDFLSGYSVVVFGIASCRPCVEFDPILSEAAERFKGRVKFGKAKMHVPGTCREIKHKYSFDTFPTTHFYKSGNLVHTLDVKVPLNELSSLIQQYLLSP